MQEITVAALVVTIMALLVETWRLALCRRIADSRRIQAEIVEEQLALFYPPAADAVKRRRDG